MIEETINTKRLKERDISISIVRLTAMVLIILCHMTSYYGNEISRWLNVGVQVFFVISGFLYGRKDISSPIVFLSRNFKKILIPYWVFLFVAIIVYALICPSELSFISILKSFFCAGTIKGLGHLWFVGYILFCYILTPYLYWFRIQISNRPFNKKVAIYMCILLLFQLISFFFDSYFEPDRVSCYILGFFLADLLGDAFRKEYMLIKWSVVVMAILMCGVEILLKYCSGILLLGWQDTAFRIFCRYSHMFLGVSLFLLLYRQFADTHYNYVLRLSDKYSYSVYLVHQLFILSPLSLMAISNYRVMNWIVVVICILLSGFILKQTAGCFEKRFKELGQAGL